MSSLGEGERRGCAVDVEDEAVVVGDGEGAGEVTVSRREGDGVPDGAAEVARGAQLPLGPGAEDLERVLALDRVGRVKGVGDGRGDGGDGVEVDVALAVGKVHDDAHGGVAPGPRRLDGLKEEAGALDDGGEQLGEPVSESVGHGCPLQGRWRPR